MPSEMGDEITCPLPNFNVIIDSGEQIGSNIQAQTGNSMSYLRKQRRVKAAWLRSIPEFASWTFLAYFDTVFYTHVL